MAPESWRFRSDAGNSAGIGGAARSYRFIRSDAEHEMRSARDRRGGQVISVHTLGCRARDEKRKGSGLVPAARLVLATLAGARRAGVAALALGVSNCQVRSGRWPREGSTSPMGAPGGGSERGFGRGEAHRSQVWAVKSSRLSSYLVKRCPPPAVRRPASSDTQPGRGATSGPGSPRAESCHRPGDGPDRPEHADPSGSGPGPWCAAPG